jgi:hypothetical protein
VTNSNSRTDGHLDEVTSSLTLHNLHRKADTQDVGS